MANSNVAPVYINKAKLMSFLNNMHAEIVQEHKEDEKYDIAVGFQSCIDYIDLLTKTGMVTIVKEGK